MNLNSVQLGPYDRPISVAAKWSYHVRAWDYNKLQSDVSNLNIAMSAVIGITSIDCSDSPNYPASLADQQYVVSVAGLIGGRAGTAVEAGDLIICTTANAGGTQVAVGADFIVVQKNMIPCTVAVLRTGTNNTDFVTAKTLKDQGITTATETIMALAGGTTQQLLLTNTGTQHGLTIAGATTGDGILISGSTGYSIEITGTTVYGFKMAGAHTNGIGISGTFSAVNSKGISTTISVNNANYTDGIGMAEFELTLTGTTAGNSAASSSWVNLITGIHQNGFICAQTNGIYEEVACTVTGANLIFGMRMQALVADSDANLYPFSCVSAVNPIKAIFSVGDPSSDMGEITDAGGASTKLVPLYKSVGGIIGYVKIYPHS
jgi:hypothetical protein